MIEALFGGFPVIEPLKDVAIREERQGEMLCLMTPLGRTYELGILRGLTYQGGYSQDSGLEDGRGIGHGYRYHYGIGGNGFGAIQGGKRISEEGWKDVITPYCIWN
jgi:hypothetical protein